MVKNVLLTGIPRSGTTLLTSILSMNPGFVTFSEPDWLKQVRRHTDTSPSFCSAFKQHLIQIRKEISLGRPIRLKQSKHQRGLPSNYYLRDEQGSITTDKTEQNITLPKGASNIPFIIKANAQFTACLDSLTNEPDFQTFCMIRNPVAAIMSWRSLEIPVSFGHMKIADKYAKDFTDFTSKASSLLEKQVLIADWFFKQYNHFKDSTTIIKYENLISDTAGELAKIVQIDAYSELPPLSSQNKNKHYNLTEYQNIKQCLIKHGRFFQAYYPEILQE